MSLSTCKIGWYFNFVYVTQTKKHEKHEKHEKQRKTLGDNYISQEYLK